MTTPTQGEHAQTALRLADEYAAAHAKWALEDLYGSSRSYTSEKLAERHAARAKLERALHAQVAALTEAPAQPAAPQGVAYAGPSEFPAGAIVNGRTHIDRLESFYRFDCEAGPLINCDDWHGLKRCFEHLVERASNGQAPAGAATPTQDMIAAVLQLVDLEQGDVEDHRYDDGSKLAERICKAVLAFVPQFPTAQAAPAAERENLELRRMLCIAHAGAAAYMDDGEAQDNRELPLIDFLHDTPAEIQDKLQRRALKKLAAQAAAPTPAAQADSPAEAVERIVHLRADRARRIYVAGPMTGLPEFNFPLFNDTAKWLRHSGWHVENPAEHGHIEGAGWADYLRWDISRIATCGAIYLLPGWEKSKGASLEVHIACVLGLEVLLAFGAQHPDAIQADSVLEDAARWQYLRDVREIALCVMFFGNGCTNITMADVIKAIDAKIAARKQGCA